MSCSSQFARLSALGMVDAWRLVNGAETREYTWFPHPRRDGRSFTGFRIDHLFLSPSLVGRVGDCRYSHAEREEGISDHSILILDLAPAA